LGVIGFILYKLVGNEFCKRAEGGKAEKPRTQTTAGKNMVKDPTCGAYIEPSSSVSVKDGESVYHFCSYECRDAFLEKLRGEGRQIPEKKS
jgi:YHS domain-containing protein